MWATSFLYWFMADQLNNISCRLNESFFLRDVLQVAPELIGKYLIINKNGFIDEYLINEVEAYRGEDDLSCHAMPVREELQGQI